MKTKLIIIYLSIILCPSCKSPELNTKNSATQTLATVTIPYRAVIFGAGPQAFVRPQTVPVLYKSFFRDYPQNGHFYEIKNFSLAKLPKLDLPHGAKVHLILNAHSLVKNGEHWTSTEDGLVKTVEVGKALGRLYGLDETVDIETSLITCFAGATDCSLFPGGVFGASSDQSVAYENSFFNFLKGLNENLYRFPMSATEMYQEYNIAERAIKSKSSVLKPASPWRQNCNGILGLKTEHKKNNGEGLLLAQDEPNVTAFCYPVSNPASNSVEVY